MVELDVSDLATLLIVTDEKQAGSSLVAHVGPDTRMKASGLSSEVGLRVSSGRSEALTPTVRSRAVSARTRDSCLDSQRQPIWTLRR